MNDRAITTILRALVVVGALVAALGTFLEWGYTLPSGLAIAPRDFLPLDLSERGVDSPYGWVVLGAAVTAAALARWRLRGIALAALPAIVGGCSLLAWVYWYEPGFVREFGFRLPVIVKNGFLVSIFGCGLVGAASLVALGMLLGARGADRAQDR